MRGLFATVEGIDGTGKSTLAGLLAEGAGFTLAPRYFTATHARQKAARMAGASLECIQRMYFEQLLEVSQQVVTPMRASGKKVLCDRWVASQKACNALHQRVVGTTIVVPVVPGTLMPDVCILLTAGDDVRRGRLSSRGELSPNDEASLLPGAAELYRSACYSTYREVVEINTTKKSPGEVLGATLQHLKKMGVI